MTVANVGYTPVSPAPVPNSTGHPAKQVQKEKPQTPQLTKAQSRNLEQIGQALNRKLQFVVEQGSNQVLIKVIDKETDKVIKVIPPEELQRLHRNMKENIGSLFNEMA